MKKPQRKAVLGKSTAVCAALACVTVLLAGCGSVSLPAWMKHKTDETEYLEVRYMSDLMSLTSPFFTDPPLWTTPQVSDAIDISAEPTRTETVFGTQAELAYKCTTHAFGHDRLEYESPDGSIRVKYDAGTGRIVGMTDRNKCPQEYDGQWLAKEAYTDAALAFAAASFPILAQYEYTISTSIGETEVNVSIELQYHGYALNEWLEFRLTPEGEVYWWVEKLLYPDGIPQEIRDAIDGIDTDLCRRSVEHYAKQHTKNKYGDKLEFVGLSDYKDIRLYENGGAACCVYTDVIVWKKEDRKAGYTKYEESAPFLVAILWPPADGATDTADTAVPEQSRLPANP